MSDPTGEHPGLPRPGASHNEEWAAAVDHRLPLRLGESLDQLVQTRRSDLIAVTPANGGETELIRTFAQAFVAPFPGGHSHSMVPGGLEVMSRATRLTPSTSLMIREERRSSKS